MEVVGSWKGYSKGEGEFGYYFEGVGLSLIKLVRVWFLVVVLIYFVLEVKLVFNRIGFFIFGYKFKEINNYSRYLEKCIVFLEK